MRKKLFGIIVALLFLSVQASAQVGGTGVYKARSAGVDVKVVRKPHNDPFVGFNAGIGGSFGAIYSPDLSLGTDIAFAPNKNFAMGFFAGYETLTKVNAGLLFVHGDYSSQGAFLWGFGTSLIGKYTRQLKYTNADQTYERRYYDGSRFLIRFGYMQKSPWYYNVTLSLGKVSRRDYYPNGHTAYYRKRIFGVMASIGYRLNTSSKRTN